MKISRRFKEGLIGGLAGFMGPAIGFAIYYIFLGYYINSLIDIIIFSGSGLISSIIMVIILKKHFFL